MMARPDVSFQKRTLKSEDRAQDLPLLSDDFWNSDNEWFNVAYRADLQRHQAGGRFTIEDLVRTA
jgi:hypothetical protein